MMSVNEISQKLRVLDLSHRDDGDGGYGLLGTVLEYGRSLSGTERLTLRRELIRLVDTEDKTMWGVSLEALVQGWSSEVAANLASLLNNSDHSDEWRAHVYLALLRLQYKPIAKQAATYIAKRISARDRTVLPLVAALSKVDPEACLQMAAPFLVDIVIRGHSDKLIGYMPAIVNHLLDADPNLLVMLVKAISVRDKDVAARIAQLMSEYLDKPYIVKRFSQSARDVLTNQLRAACDGH
jgi:hypothetical protein